MLDVVFLATLGGFFAACVLFVKACDALTGRGSPDPVDGAGDDAFEAAAEVTG